MTDPNNPQPPYGQQPPADPAPTGGQNPEGSDGPSLQKPPVSAGPSYGEQTGYAAPTQSGYGDQSGYGQQQPAYGQQPGYGDQSGYGQQAAYGQQTGYGNYATGGPSKVVAILALIAGVVALLLCWIPVFGIFWAGFFGLAAIGLGIVGLVQAKKGTADGKGMSLAGLIVGVVAILASVVITVVFFAAVGTGINESFDSLESLEANAGGENTDQILADNLDVEFGTFEVTGDPTFPDTSLPVTFTNKGDSEASFSVNVEAVVDGTVVDDDIAFTATLEPGASEDIELFMFVVEPEQLEGAEFRVSSVTMFDF